MIFVPNLVTDHLIESVISRLNEKVGIFEEILKKRELLREDDLFGMIHRGTKVRVAKFPAIRVIYIGVESRDFATRTLEETHNFNIDIMYKLNSTGDKTVPEEAVTVLGRSVQAFLNQYRERQFAVKGDREKVNVTAGDSFAPSITLGYSETGAVRIARISYWVKLYPTYMT